MIPSILLRSIINTSFFTGRYVLPPLPFYRSLSLHEYLSKSISLPIFPLTFKNDTILLNKLSMSIFITIYKISIIDLTLYPCVHAIAIHFTIFPVSIVDISIFKGRFSLVIDDVVFEDPFILKLFILVFAESLFDSVFKLPLI